MRSRPQGVLALILAVLAAAAASGCRSSSAPTGQTSDATRTAKPIRIAMIAKSSTNPIFLSARRGAETAARDLSAKIGQPIEIVWLTPPTEDGQIQAQRIARRRWRWRRLREGAKWQNSS